MRIRAGLAALLVAAVAIGCSDEKTGRVGGAGGDGGSDGSGGMGGGETVDFTIEGLSDAVQVTFDAQHVLHLSCKTDEDCAAVLGWFHAQHRFWQMDLFRRVARGRGATLVSAYRLDDDVAMRRFMSTRDGTPIEEAIWVIMPDETKSIVEAYARGVNAWLEDVRAGRNGAALSEEYRIALVQGDPDEIPDWEALDSVAFARLMTWQLSDSSEEEINAGGRFAALEPEQAVALFTLAPATRANTYGVSGETFGAPAAALASAGSGFDRRAIEKAQARLAHVRDILDAALSGIPKREILGAISPEATAGSNNWVLAPGRTAAGKALLANDPHLDLNNPAIWYFAHLDAVTDGEGTMNVAGGTFPGIPGVPIGRNANVAWGNTTAYYDVTDVYVETRNEAGDAVLFDADGDGTVEEVPIIRREVTFERLGGEPTTVTLEWVPHHGPIVTKADDRPTVSVRWTGHEATDELTAFLGLSRATSVAQAREALRHFKVGAQNFLLVDTGGHIGWWPHANVPRRPWASFEQASPLDPESGSLPPWLPLPGDGSAEWDGYLSDEELPQLWDPASGVIATANQPMTPALDDGDPTNDGIPVLQTGSAHGFRMQRIADLLEAGGDAHTPETMHAIQADTHSLPGEAVVPAVLAAADAAGDLDEAAQRMVERLRAWEFTCPTGLAGTAPDAPGVDDPAETREAVGCTAFHYLLPKIYAHAFGDEADRAGMGLSHQFLRPLVLSLHEDTLPVPFDPHVFWDDLRTPEVESRDEILVAALRAAATEGEGRLGADDDGWRWGRVHTLTLSHPLEDAVAALAHGPFANDGGLFTVDVANPRATARFEAFNHGHGASLRMVNEADESGIRTWLQLPGGQVLHRDSPHHADLLPAWLANESFELPFTPDEVDAAAVERLLVAPPEE